MFTNQEPEPQLTVQVHTWKGKKEKKSLKQTKKCRFSDSWGFFYENVLIKKRNFNVFHGWEKNLT